MRWLRRFSANKMNPMGPDFKSAPLLHFNLSGTSFKFHSPRSELVSGVTQGPLKIDLYKDEAFEAWSNNKGFSCLMISTGWKYWDKPFGEGAIGSLSLKVRVRKRHPHFNKPGSLFSPSELKLWILEYCEDVWGSFNKNEWARRHNKVIDIDPERDFFRYPKSNSDIEVSTFAGTDWYSYTVGKPSSPRQALYHTPISDDHDIALHFEAKALNREYNNGDHNIDDAVERSISDFMATTSLQLSEEYQKRKQEAQAKE
ncbi:hypothetical protein HCH_03402 [Hahella chejuensis KCTC 2396]|uniref:Uncharacterized protein n=1 Tax=Hahella chejuensis (strain KCTC 2396) TaxID=349521 RepID=Q2SGS2_HAHCH|nr:hypothetical protein [Hahella chejuensis]ABC30152.1 hypothetical protein HCH_03402 [Hahella chejuensis KCTC 2396]